MNNKLLVTILVLFGLFVSCAKNIEADDSRTDSTPPVVYFTTDVSPEGLMAVYKALGVTPSGKVAVKIHSGEPGNRNFLRPDFMAELVQSVNGSFIETNVAYPGPRATTANHLKVGADHGFTAVAPFVILDADGEISLPVKNGRHLKENLVGSKFVDFDYHIVISHFKGHQMGGFGGALKNLSIGYASKSGKALIHSHGKSKTNPWGGNQIPFLESMAEAAKTVVDRANGNILYINVMNKMSVDCDCDGGAALPKMDDIGILASLDPVALDQACIDLVWKAHDSKELIQRIVSKHGLRTIEYAAEIGLGSREYELVEVSEN